VVGERTDRQPNGTTVAEVALGILIWGVRHWFLVLVVIGALYGLVHVAESEHPRSGYVDTGETLTPQQCIDQGGDVVDDVCYGP
jgi:hypothetical protein